MEDEQDLAAKEERAVEGDCKAEEKEEEEETWVGGESEGCVVDLEGGREYGGFEDALRIEWSKVYARAQRWNEEVRLLKEDFCRVPISLKFEADRWVERAKALSVGTGDVDEASVQGMIACALKQRAIGEHPKIAKGKKQPRVPIVDPLVQRLGVEEGGDDDNDDGVLREEENDGVDAERGVVESKEELVMGGEMDDVGKHVWTTQAGMLSSGPWEAVGTSVVGRAERHNDAKAAGDAWMIDGGIVMCPALPDITRDVPGFPIWVPQK
ncbi:hypothetical protein B0H14DRAFT_2633763 [Mycena olivaceomarginata]|nr:hypothetical protein B0H14DRAFT_2633763 [Mycena olivaceomarginata]